MRKKINYLLVIMLFFLVPNNVWASVPTKYSVSYVGGHNPLFSKYGISTVCNSTSGYKKTSDGKEAYCTLLDAGWGNGTYKTCKNLKVSANKKLVAGQIVELIKAKNWDTTKKYGYIVASLNKYFNFSSKCSISGGSDWKISDIISKAKKEAEKYPISSSDEKKAFKTMSHADMSGTLNPVSSASNNTTFISNKITYNGLKDKVGGSTPSYVFSISGVSASNAQLCSGSSGSGCVSLSSADPETHHYLKVTGITTTTNIQLTLSGSVTFKYKTGDVYCSSSDVKNEKGDKFTSQPVFIVATDKNKIDDQDVINFKATVNPPSEKISHEIEIVKVDETGTPLKGAEFSYTFPETLSKSVSSDGTTFTYTYGPVDKTADRFYGKEFCYTETKAPDGFVLKENSKICINIKAGNESFCYKNNDTPTPEEVDSDYCNTNIKKICKVITKHYTEVEVQVPGEEGEQPTIKIEKQYGDEIITYQERPDDVGCPTGGDDGNGIETTYEEICGIFKGENVAPDEKNNTFCENPGSYEKVTYNNGLIRVVKQNELNSVKISKQDMVGGPEIPGAHLRVCTKDSYDAAKNKVECEPAKTIGGTSLDWDSGLDPMEFNGIKPGTYYVIETLPPDGYELVSTATMFKMDVHGNIETGTTNNVKDNTIVINDAVNRLHVSKVSSIGMKGLSGAKLAICEVNERYASIDGDGQTVTTEEDDESDDTSNSEDSTDTDGSTEVVDNPDAPKYKTNNSDKNDLYLDMYGECIPVRLYDGTSAEWTSDGKDHEIKGLPIGTYYLVEKVAPFGYATSKSILFHMTANGKITDKNGKAISNNKLVMKDEPIKDVKTGILPMIIVGSLGIGAIGGVGYAYHKSTVKNLPRRRKK